MTTRYVIRTIDEDWIDLADEPVRIDDRHAAWAEAKRRVAADPDLKTVVLNRDTGAILWQSDPNILPRYQVVTANRTFVYAIDHVDFPVAVGDVKIYVSGGSGVLPVVHNNRKKEHPDATAICND